MKNNHAIYEIIVVLVVIINLSVGTYTGPNKVAIVNKEQPYVNKTYQPCSYKPGCYFLNLTCSLLDKIVKNTEKEYYVTPEDAQDALENGDIWAIFYFPRKFTDSLMSRTIHLAHASEQLLQESQMQVWIRGDYSNDLEDFQQSFKIFTIKLIRKCGSPNINLQNLGLLVLYKQVINPKLSKLAIINEDQIFVNKTYQPCHFEEDCTTNIQRFSNMSCKFLDTIKDETIEYYSTLEDGLNDLQKGDAWGAIHVKKGFSDAIVASLSLTYDPYYIQYGYINQIRIWIHPLRESTKIGLGEKDLQQRFTKVIENLLKTCRKKGNNIPEWMTELTNGFSTKDIKSIAAF
uniref:Uncharacterized protein LOC114330004 n=1 Tax=Diabrotica virgifera virgifera TaxID=50390 RepID=A0A6P7FJC1_DIAVI